MSGFVKQDIIEKKIFLIRDLKVMLDKDLAELYGVTTGNLNKAVNRNPDRFPDDFMFRLTKEEFRNLRFCFGISSLRSQFVTSSWGGYCDLYDNGDEASLVTRIKCRRN